jgi:riboflavin synthase
MFTGLIECVGRIAAMRPATDGLRLAIESDRPLAGLALGESIAVDGVCLTVVTHAHDRRFEVDVSSESVAHSIVGGYRVGSQINLERALQLGDRLGGHLVSGHVDGQGALAQRHAVGASTRLTFTLDPRLCSQLVPRGSVAINGVSLTIIELAADSFGVNVIPHTAVETNLVDLAVGAPVNIELDMLVKMVSRLLSAWRDGASPGNSQPEPAKKDISLEMLARSGFIGTPSGGRGGGGRR